jgi:hypothetical protein
VSGPLDPPLLINLLLRAADARRRMAARVHRSLGLTPKRYWFRSPIPAMARNTPSRRIKAWKSAAATCSKMVAKNT